MKTRKRTLRLTSIINDGLASTCDEKQYSHTKSIYHSRSYLSNSKYKNKIYAVSYIIENRGLMYSKSISEQIGTSGSSMLI